jgi:hypothetical protein
MPVLSVPVGDAREFEERPLAFKTGQSAASEVVH